jgi:hypothetical protein
VKGKNFKYPGEHEFLMKNIFPTLFLICLFIASPLTINTANHYDASSIDGNETPAGTTNDYSLYVPQFSSFKCDDVCFFSNNINANSMKSSGMNQTIHAYISGQKFWVSFNFNCTGPTSIRVIFNFREFSLNGSSRNCFFFKYEGLNQVFHAYNWNALNASPDFYIKYQLGKHERSYYHPGERIDFWTPWESEMSFFGDGKTRFTVGTFTNYSSLELWINYTSDDPMVTMKEGQDVYAFDRSNYTGPLNIGWKKGTYVKEGEIEIPIKNHLIAWYDLPYFSTGKETLKYRTPAGQEEWLSYSDKNGTHISANSSQYFRSILFSEQSGTWCFSLDMMNMIRFSDRENCELGTPNVILFVADIPDVSAL